MADKCFPLIRGRAMRVTRLDGCGVPVPGSGSVVTTKGFISVALTSNTIEGEPIQVTNANGENCVNDTPAPKFTGFGAEVTMCKVDPRLFSLMTGQSVVRDASGNVVGFDVESDVDLDDQGFAIELWSKVPAEACEPGQGQSYGYFLLPFLKGGVLGDFTVENAAINLVITGAQTKDGSSWGVGPYNVVNSAGTNEVQTITISGTPTGGDFTITFDGEETDAIAYNANAAAVQAALEALSNVNEGDVTVTGGPGPGTPYVVTFSGEYGYQNIDLMEATGAFTGGTDPDVAVTQTTAGAAGAPGPLLTPLSSKNHLRLIQTQVAPPTDSCGGTPLGSEATGATEVEGGAATLTPANSYAPADLADANSGDFTASPGTAWDTGSYVTLEDGSLAHWDGSDWVEGEAP